MGDVKKSQETRDKTAESKGLDPPLLICEFILALDSPLSTLRCQRPREFDKACND